MRNSRVLKTALPLVAAAGFIGGTMAPAASAHMLLTPHGCGATTAWAKQLIAFAHSYDKGAKALGNPSASSEAGLVAYLDKAEAFFNSTDQAWAVIGKAAPSSVSVGWDTSVADLQKAATDFGAAAKALAAGDVSVMKSDLKQAEAASSAFGTVLAPVWKKCS